jgi:acetylornithine deacetylase/succinyl-diaminopimelate desuccinylase-like protein
VAEGLSIVKREFEKFGRRRTAELELEDCYRGTVIPQTAMRLMELRAGNAGADLDTGHLEYTYYTTRTEPEINAEFEEIRASVTPELSALGLELQGIYMTTRFFHFIKSAESTLPRLLNSSAAEAGSPAPTQCGASLSDLSLFIKYGSPTAISFGVGRDFSDYGGAHQTDEFIECDKLLDLTRTLAVFLLNYGL